MINLSDRLATEKVDSSPAFRQFYVDDSLMENFMITKERLKEVLSYDPETGIFTSLISRGSIKPGDVINGCKSHGYLVTRIDDVLYRLHRLAWLYMYGEWPKGDTDHLNMIRDDNRIINLREATRSENMRNSIGRSNNLSGVKGVSFDKARNKWQAHISVNKTHIALGRFDTKERAANAYKNAAKNLHGEFMRCS